jgi:hypothetical protein
LTVLEVEKELTSMKARKATGIDGLPNWVFKNNAKALAPAVTLLFNCSIRTCTVPLLFKVANVIPIPKCSKPTEKDYRPISLLVNISKILERLIIRRWVQPVIKPIMDPLQFAFVPGIGKGTVCALTLQQHIVLQHLDSNPGIVRMLQVDLRKAFDKASHRIILRKLTEYGVSNKICKWIWSYLTGRFQRVKMDSSISEWIPICSGVPQGSVMGPLLFAILVNDLRPCSPRSTLIKYADDLTFLHCLRSPTEDELQDEINNLETWSANVELPINFDKTFILDYTTLRQCQLQQRTTSSGDEIVKVESTKLLGMTLTSNTKWNTHFDAAIVKASRRLHILRQLARAKCPTNWMWNSYYALIRSVISYGFPAACNAPQNILQKFTALERRAARIIGEDIKGASILQHLEEICIRFAKKCSNSTLHPLNHLFIAPVQRERRTKHKRRFTIPQCRTTRFKNSFIRFYSDL